jgi:hypothetical protein
MRDFLRFFLSSADQARVNPASVTAVDLSPAVNSFGGDITQISFTINNPAAGAPQLLPIFPGIMIYEAEPGAPGDLPEPADIILTPTGYAKWRTRGTLLVGWNNNKIEAGMLEHGLGLEVQPNMSWYWPVQLPETFMLTTLTSGLRKVDVIDPTSGKKIKPAHPDWPKHAVSRFLQGRYFPELRLGSTAADDDVVKNSMPTAVMSSNGEVTLTIAIARWQHPQDGSPEELSKLTPSLSIFSPFNARYGGIPARHVYRSLRAHLIDAGPSAPLADKILHPWPRARRYFPFRLTRTWQDVPNFSVQFPLRHAKVMTGPSSSLELRIPPHGVVYVPQDPANPPPPLPVLTLDSIMPSTTPPTTFLDGMTPDAWKVRSGTSPIPLSNSSVTHVILRRPMGEEILADSDFPNPDEDRCTYMSLRRATRAFVDHRLTGGRLTHEGRKTQDVTKRLMVAAWNTDSAKILWNNNPTPGPNKIDGDRPGKQARRLEKIWQLFFPDIVPAKVIDSSGSTHRTVFLDGGRMMYSLWQSNEDAFAGNGSKRNFSNDHVAMGAPGAIVSVGLSKGFLTTTIPHKNPSPTEPEIQNNVSEMLQKLTPGCLLQYWSTREGYQLERSRSGTIQSGHSPIFQEYMLDASGNKVGIKIVDQNGNNIQCPVVNGRIKYGVRKDIWIAAQWDD